MAGNCQHQHLHTVTAECLPLPKSHFANTVAGFLVMSVGNAVPFPILLMLTDLQILLAMPFTSICGFYAHASSFWCMMGDFCCGTNNGFLNSCSITEICALAILTCVATPNLLGPTHCQIVQTNTSALHVVCPALPSHPLNLHH